MNEQLSLQPFDTLRPDQKDAITCCSNGPLVYVRNLKCASTFFGSSFLSKWRWEPIKWSEINWSTQHVFSHMLDPIERRIKGIAEYIDTYKVNDLFNTNQQFQQFVVNAVALDEHTLSYHDTFGNLVYHIDWIPLSGYTHEQTIAFTERLLRHYGIRTLHHWDYTSVHRTHPEKKSIEDLVRQLHSDQKTWPSSIHWHLDKDVILFNHIKEKFNPAVDTWNETSWLRL